MAIIFDSGLMDFASDENHYIEVVHNLGKKPPIIQFLGEKDGLLGFPRLLGSTGIDVPGPYLTETNDPNKVKVFKPNAYTFNGKFRIRIYE